MPQLFKGKVRRLKKPYKRSTGNVSEHTQRYNVGSRKRRIKRAQQKYWDIHGASEYGFEPPEEFIEYDMTQNWHRFRIRDPEEFEPGSFRTLIRNKGNTHVIIGRLKGQKTTTTQAIRYRRRDN